jgi:hypothetical protein
MPETGELRTTPTEFSLACRNCGESVAYEAGDVEGGLIDCESCGTANLHPIEAGAALQVVGERAATRRSKGAK